jgi:hypothetical protein
MTLFQLSLLSFLSVAASSDYDRPICRAHEGTVLSFCNGSPFRGWGVGPEGETQAIKNCQWAANKQQCVRNATVDLDPFTRRSIGTNASATIDRMQWFGGHWNIYKGIQWRDDDLELFHGRYHAHPGRSFYISYRMSQCTEDPARPGFVDVDSLIASCANMRKWSIPAWPLEAMDMIVSSKPDQLYPNSCGERGGAAPRGFSPGSHAAAGEFFALFYEHCMPPTGQDRVFMEVSNECDVKTFSTKCNSPWSEMVALHAEVGNALHAAYNKTTASSAYRTRPFVCGPTEAFPEYQLNDFRTWRAGGQLAEFMAGTMGGGGGSSIDCLSTHIYSTYQITPNATGRDSWTDPFSSNYVAREVGNSDAILDMQEAAMAAAAVPAAILISEYGAAFKDKLLHYHPAHDFWILRAVNNKLMTFLERPDRILKALPFIVDKATWHAQGMQNNASQSYPQAMWRFVRDEWQITHLHKFYGAWRDFGGERFRARSDNAHVQVHAAAIRTASGTAAHANWTVAVNNVDHLVPARVQLAWPPLPAGTVVVGVSVRRLAWDAAAEIPSLTDTEQQRSLPTTLMLAPAELALVTVGVEVVASSGANAAAVLAPTAHINTRTFPSPQRLVPLPSTAAGADTVPFRFLGALEGGALPLSVRVSLGGPGTARAAILAKLNIVVNGVACVVNPTRQVGGQQHLSPSKGSFFGAIEVSVPATAVERGPRPGIDAIVKVWADMVIAAGDDPMVVSTVALLVETNVSMPTPTSVSATTTSQPLVATTTDAMATTTHASPPASDSTTTSNPLRATTTTIQPTSVTATTTQASPPPSVDTTTSNPLFVTTTDAMATTTQASPPASVITTTSNPVPVTTTTSQPTSVSATTTSQPLFTTTTNTRQTRNRSTVKGSAVPPSNAEHPSTPFVEIVIGVGVVGVVAILGFYGLRAMEGAANTAKMPPHVQLNMNSWSNRRKNKGVAIAYIEQGGSSTNKGVRRMEMASI